jgi:hypothetical protein
VGELEGDVDYRELLRSKGIVVPATVADSSPMEEVIDSAVDDDSSMD